MLVWSNTWNAEGEKEKPGCIFSVRCIGLPANIDPENMIPTGLQLPQLHVQQREAVGAWRAIQARTSSSASRGLVGGRFSSSSMRRLTIGFNSTYASSVRLFVASGVRCQIQADEQVAERGNKVFTQDRISLRSDARRHPKEACGGPEAAKAASGQGFDTGHHVHDQGWSLGRGGVV